MHNALILHYHESVINKNAEVATLPAAVTSEEFAAQLGQIRKLRLPVVSLEELVENDRKRKRWHRHVVLLTFTEGFLAQNPTVLQLLKDSGFPATVFIATGGITDAKRKETWQEWVTAGFSLGSHSVSQARLTSIPEEEMRRNLAGSKQIIEAETGKPVRFLLPPSGAFNKKIVAAAQELGYEALLSFTVGYNRFNADLFRLKTWPVPPHTSLKAFEHMLLRDKKELLVQELKAQALKNGSKLRPKSLFGKLKHLFRRVQV